MQRLLSLKLASSLSRKLNSSSSSSSSVYKNFAAASENNTFTSSLTKPPHHFSHSWHPDQNFSQNVPGVLSDSILARRILAGSSNTLSGFLSKSLADCRAQFRGGKHLLRKFEFISNSDPFRRARRSWFQGLTSDNVVLGLIIANVAVFVLWQVADRSFMRDHFMISLDNVKSGRVHTLITSAFSHVDIGHIVSNMIGLYFFGLNIGRTFGPEFLLKLYIAGALGGSLCYLLHHALMKPSAKGQGMWNVLDPSRAPGLGASGAVNAIMLLDIFLNPKATLLFDFFIPVPAILLGIYLIAKDMMRVIEGDSYISGSAHLGGAAVAAVALARIKKGRF